MILSFDLTDYYAQISYMDTEDKPHTFPVDSNKRYNIPVCLCKRHGINQWYFGEQAMEQANSGKGTLITNIFSLASDKKTIVIENMEINTEELLVLFIKKCLGLTNVFVEGNGIDGLMITCHQLSKRVTDLLHEMKDKLPIRTSNYNVQSHEESLFYYLINQEKELWNHYVYVFDLSLEYLIVYSFSVNKKTKPMLTFIERSAFEDIKKGDVDADEKLLHLAQKLFLEKTISSVYLIGEGFEGDWYKEALNYLCRGRRVFGGNNIYSKGACYGMIGNQVSKDYLLIGENKVKFNLEVYSNEKDEITKIPLFDAGINWYDIFVSKQFIARQTESITFHVISLDKLQERDVSIELEGLSFDKTPIIRLDMEITMVSVNQISVKIRDLGFGDFYESSKTVWSEMITI